jgi:hypothetical protein
MFWGHNRVGAWGRRMGCRSVGICDDAELPDSGKYRIIRDCNSAPPLGTSPASSQLGWDLRGDRGGYHRSRGDMRGDGDAGQAEMRYMVEAQGKSSCGWQRRCGRNTGMRGAAETQEITGVWKLTEERGLRGRRNGGYGSTDGSKCCEMW